MSPAGNGEVRVRRQLENKGLNLYVKQGYSRIFTQLVSKSAGNQVQGVESKAGKTATDPTATNI